MESICPEERNGLALVADDDAVMRLLLRESLETGGFSVEEAENGEQAVAAFEQCRPDIVVLDVMMPEMNGFDSCSAIRKMHGGAEVPVLMVTGMDDVGSISRAFEVGATDFITKPINWMIFSERVRYMLRSTRAMEQLRRSEASLAKAQMIAHIGNWELDMGRNEFRCSAQTYNICGLHGTKSGMEFDAFLKCAHPDDLDMVMKAMNQAIEQALPSKIDHRIMLPTGAIRTVFQQLEVTCDESGNTVEVAGTIQDITERKQAEMLEIDRNHVLEMVIRDAALNDILAQLVYMIERQRPEGICCLLLLRSNKLHVGASVHMPDTLGSALDGLQLGPKTGCFGAAAYFGYPMVATDVTSSTIWQDFREVALDHGIKASYSVPILSGKGQILGTLSMFYDQPYRPQNGDIKLLEMVSKLGAIAIEQRQLTERLAYQAHHDALTSLPNRVLLADSLDRALSRGIRYNEKLALLCIDLDRFKHINDSLGHHTGDLLLKQVAERLAKCTRKSDTLARMGGDEFILVLNRITDREAASKTARRILELIEEPYRIECRELHLSASIGISTYPDDGLDSVTLQKHADIAMYYAKNQGGNRYQFFTQEMQAVVVERLELENELRKAFERKELDLHYQPQYELNGRKLVGVEALLRWQHPEIGLIPPSKVIPIAEETGLIVPIGAWVLQEACRKNAEWQRAGYPAVKVGVNVSAIQFMQADFVNVVASALEQSGLEPRWLEIEVTESVVIKDLKSIAKRLTELHALGVSIAIDDFGKGYTSMAYLQLLPVDCLKIDQTFVQDIENFRGSSQRSRTLIKAFVSLAYDLGLKLLAEGVESQEQYSFLNDIGCELGQGFLLDVPMPASEIENLWQKFPQAAASPGQEPEYAKRNGA